MKVSAARILVNLTLPKEVRKLSDSNTLGNLLKLFNVEKLSWRRQKYARWALLNCNETQ